MSESQADFYLLSSSREQDERDFVCRLAEKVIASGSPALLIASNTQQLHALDNLLWTFTDTSFLAHEVHQPGQSRTAPLVLALSVVDGDFELLINLSDQEIEDFGRFKRILEVVPNRDYSKDQARQRYRIYKQAGYTINSHNL